ncbi:MAG: hypothetical protein FVQ79_05930 [Planctomycetes bacterium]|nr:hypothetical protein [Planctomycetota bacterium]
MKLWDRIHRGMEAGFDASISAVHTLTEKAGEGIELTRSRREKSRYETQLTKLLAELGNTVYEKLSEGRLNEIAEQLEIKDKLTEIAEQEAQMVKIDKMIGKELGIKEIKE